MQRPRFREALRTRSERFRILSALPEQRLQYEHWDSEYAATKNMLYDIKKWVRWVQQDTTVHESQKPSLWGARYHIYWFDEHQSKVLSQLRASMDDRDRAHNAGRASPNRGRNRTNIDPEST